MWLVTSIGFFRVDHQDGEAMLSVRARSEAELGALRERVPALGPTEMVVEGEMRVPVARCPSVDFSRVLVELVCDLDYKSLVQWVAKTPDGAAALRELQPTENSLRVPGAADFPARGEHRPIPTSYGGVVVDPGRTEVLLHAEKVREQSVVRVATTGPRRSGEPPRRTAVRNVQSRLGMKARILQPLPRWYEGDADESALYLMSDEKDSTDHGRPRLSPTGVPLSWATLDDARTIVRKRGVEISRELKVLDDVANLLGV